MAAMWTTSAGHPWGDEGAGRVGRRYIRHGRRAGQDADLTGRDSMWRGRVVLRRYDGRVRAALLAIWRASSAADSHTALLALVHRYDNGRLVLQGDPGNVD